jgi:hypothetical protein
MFIPPPGCHLRVFIRLFYNTQANSCVCNTGKMNTVYRVFQRQLPYFVRTFLWLSSHEAINAAFDRVLAKHSNVHTSAFNTAHWLNLTMDVEKVECLWFHNRRYKRQKQWQRQYWVHHILRDKVTHGMFEVSYRPVASS